MAKSLDEELEEFRKELREDAKEIRDAFEGKYGNELKELCGLSPAKVDELTPDVTDIETYRKLIAVVEAASRRNLAQGALKDQIMALGGIAVKIAKMTTGLGGLFK